MIWWRIIFYNFAEDHILLFCGESYRAILWKIIISYALVGRFGLYCEWWNLFQLYFLHNIQ